MASVVTLERILRLLGLDASELGEGMVSVSASGLRRVLSILADLQPFDADFYTKAYPDIEAARLAGTISDLRAHFIHVGFFEGRLPSDPPFDPVWYSEHYPDLSSVIPAGDVERLRNHFLTAGLAEGRAGTAAELAAAAIG
jgi:hypothetical protein